MSTGPVPHVVVVGGGIAGLAAAWFLGQRAAGAVRVTVLEAGPVVGGKLRVSEVAGLPVDEGAEALLVRRSEAVALTRAVGLGDDVVHPAVQGATLWTRDRLRPMPAGQLMGIPGDLRALAASGTITLPGLARIPLDHVLPRTPVSGDVSVGRFVSARLGREVLDRLVEPVLGGVYAGHADELSLDATIPQLSGAIRVERSLLKGVQQVLGAGARGNAERAPVFASLRGGLGRLPAAVAAASRAEVRTGATVRELRRSPGGWRVVIGPTRSPEVLFADAVVLAVPAPPASRLLRDVAPSAATDLAAIEYASVALVTLAFPRDAVTRPLAGTGFLVPPVEERFVKAATYSSRKWAWLEAADPGVVVVRLSVGRHGEEQDLQHTDEDLAWWAQADLETATDIVDAPLDWRVTRWGGGLPQYAVGHLDRVTRIRRAVAELTGLAVCGAAYDGVGVPACVASADAAVARVLRDLAERRQWGNGSDSRQAEGP
ncbi:MAG: protoporphyrinogen oxidase [Actinomycetia bacterium]|nr:protoporphyrinogen oxidase [Actinomycetes bacterium]